MVYTLRFSSSKCSLFHNSNVFGSCIIRILCTEFAKVKTIIPAPKGYLGELVLIDGERLQEKTAGWPAFRLPGI